MMKGNKFILFVEQIRPVLLKVANKTKNYKYPNNPILQQELPYINKTQKTFMVSTLHDCKRKEKYKIFMNGLVINPKQVPGTAKAIKFPEKLYHKESR